jgi:uncharacterized protein (TIGR00255 family)
MTGFAEKNFRSKYFSVKISIRSLNHRFFDWNYRGSQIKEVENRLRTHCLQKLHRGRIEVTINLDFLDSVKWDFKINHELLSKIISSLDKVSTEMSQNITFSVENLFGIPHVIDLKRKSFTKEEILFIEDCFEKALDDLIRMRKREGREIKREIRGRLRNMRKEVNRIKKLAQKQPLLIRDKLRERLKELNEDISVTDEKLVKEAAYIAQKFDLNEEITRLLSHLDYASDLLSAEEEEPVGKKLDFMAQELFREANTINSKAQDMDIIKASLAIKSEVESIRQQVQNLE